MKQVIVILLVLLLLAATVSPVIAGGDKVHGEKGDGPVNQNGECPFGGEDSGDNSPWPEPPQVGRQ